MKIIFSEYGLPNKIFSDVDTNIVPENLDNFCKRLGIWHVVSSSYKHQINGQAAPCIQFVKRTIAKCYDTNVDIHMSLLQVISAGIGAGLTSPAIHLLNRSSRGLLLSRWLIICDNDESNHTLFCLQEQLWWCNEKIGDHRHVQQ